MNNQPILIVTRHPALVQFLAEELGIEGEVIPHATPDMIRNRRVVGVLPLHLAALCESVTSVELNLPPELRGVELSLDQIKAHFVSCHTYVVRDLIGYNDEIENNCLSAMQGGMWTKLKEVPRYIAG